MQGDVGVGSFVERIDFTGGIGIRVDVDAGGALLEFGKIENLMDGLLALHGARMIGVHVIRHAGRKIASAASRVLIGDAEILNAQFANGHGHPAVLSAMIVDAADLAGLPADGKDFEEVAFENEIPGVVAPGVEKIGLERFDANLILLEVCFDFRERKVFAMNCRKAADPFIDRHLRQGKPPLNVRVPVERKYSAEARPERNKCFRRML